MGHLDRRSFLRAACGAGAVLACDMARSRSQSDVRPNIVVMMADDMGYSDLGCYGGEIDTPRIDALAEGGMRFRQFYNAARCCPTRASLLTGLYPHQTGLGHMTNDFGLPGYRGDLNRNSVTLAEVLRPAGYTTLVSGKWHVTPAVKTPDKRNWPLQRGFDRFYGTIRGGGSYYSPAPLTRDNELIEPEGQDFYYTTAIGENAARYIAEAPLDRPFLLYVAFTSPHFPLHAPEDAVQKYRGRYDGGWDLLREERYRRMIDMGVIQPEWRLTPRDKGVPSWDEVGAKAWQARRMEVYAAQIELMDRAVGGVVDALEARGSLDNTLVLFLADNGGNAERLRGNDPAVMPGPAETNQSYGAAWANASNTPFRYYKHWVHEGGVASPLIAHWPRAVRTPGAWVDEPGHVIDIMATCLELSGAEYPAEVDGVATAPLEGKSLAPLLRGEPRESHEALYWEHEGNRAVRRGQWKLVSKWGPPENSRWELYDLEADRSEMNDLAAAQPDKAKELSRLWQAWADQVGVVEWKSWEKPSRPRPAIDIAVDAAALLNELVPAGLGTLYGQAFADAVHSASSVPLPRELGGVRVLVDGIEAPLLYVDPRQINFQVPQQALLGEIRVERNGVLSERLQAEMVSLAPRFFTYPRTPKEFDPVVTHADGIAVSPTAPAGPGETLLAFLTGMPLVSNPPADGEGAPSDPLSVSTVEVGVRVANAEATPLFAGVAPGLVGVLQVNFTLPSTLPPAEAAPLRIRFADVETPSVRLWIGPP